MITRIADIFRSFRPGRHATPPGPPRPHRVLLVYDEENVRHWLVSLLNRIDGLVCQDTDGGREDLDRLAARLEPDLILLDARRIDARSRDLVRRLKRRRPGRRVFLLGLDEGAGYYLSAERAGADGYVSTTRVVESLENILGRNDRT